MLPLFSLTGDYSCAEYRLGWERKTIKKTNLKHKRKAPPQKCVSGAWILIDYRSRLMKSNQKILVAYFADTDAR